MSCRLIDLPHAVDAAGDTVLVEAMLDELAVTATDATAHELVTYRNGERRQQDFERLHPQAGDTPTTRLHDEGVYLVTGGLGGLGRTLAAYLAETYRARLVLIGRSSLPEPEAWASWLEEHGEDDATSVKIRALQAMQSAGGEVMVESADVADVEALRAVRDAAVQRFGRIDGVIHAAGIPGGGILQLKTAEAATAILSPKVDGVRALAEVFLGDDELDFLFIYSSVASILGEFGQADYCAANAFLDAFAAARAGRRPPVLTVNWDVWGDVGLAVDTEVPGHLRAWREEMLAKGLRSSEGLAVFERLLTAGLDDTDQPQLVVSTQDLHGRIELGKSFTGERFLNELGLAPEVADSPAPEAAKPISKLGSQAMEQRLTEIWEKVLGVEVKVQDNFFDLGGNSLVGLQLVGEVNREFGSQVTPVELFERPTVRGLRQLLEPESEPVQETAPRARRQDSDQDVAIVGMAGRFPGAADVDELWQNLRDGVESVRFFSDEELLAAGVAPELLEDPLYVRAGSVVDGIDLFDARLFGYSPREAEIMDPQQRLFLECAWEALETAACDPRRYPGRIGAFAGSNLSTYLLKLHADPEVAASLNMLQAILGNDKDALTTRVSYKLDLTGPSIAVQTFCSTSLVAVHMAARSLLDGDCDAALAGGIRIVVPSEQGYLYEERGIAPRDGHTRSFDASATGAVLGNGVGVVVLKRLEDAIADGDPIRAVIKGSAINNDGAGKAGYTAPSVDGQVQVVRDALAAARVDPETVSYVEAHGSATELGDPIEVTALTRAYGSANGSNSKCAIGSVKSNFGHLDRAAGVAGLIKTVMSLERRELVPSINYETPNPQIDFASSPFQVQVERASWERNGHPRRAGVNSLGMGGTNVHVILEEAPEVPIEEAAVQGGTGQQGAGEDGRQLLALSAATPWSLERATERLAEHLESRQKAGGLDAAELADVAYTLQMGRRELSYRRMLVCRDGAGAVAGLAGRDKARALFSGHAEDGGRTRVFLFPGLGGQYVTMGRGLYDQEPVFRDVVDRAATLLEPQLGVDLREVLYPAPDSSSADGSAAPSSSNDNGQPKIDLRAMLKRGQSQGENATEAAQQRLDRTLYTQPALFVVEYALARLWLERGVQPDSMLGYSIGEYVAACLAGVMSFEDALELVAFRARLIEDLPAGGMLAVALEEIEVAARLEDHPELSIAAVNTPQQTVVAGPDEALDRLTERLEAEGVSSRRLQVSHAFHSVMLSAAAEALTERAARIELSAPDIPFVSNVTGTWISDEDATAPSYWARHMCQAVRFSDGLEVALAKGSPVLLEVGPQALSSLALQHPAASASEGGTAVPVVSSLRHAFESGSDSAYLLSALGKLWLAGAEIEWHLLHGEAPRRRRLLPTYAFDRQRYWIETRADHRLSTPVTSEAASADPGDVGVGSYARPDLRVEYVAPRDELEESIAVIWRELLGVAQVGINDNLLELGGDSLLATRMISRLREVVGFELPIRLFFEAPTIDQLATAIRELQAEQSPPPDPVDDPGEIEQDDLQELLALVGQMSEEELDAELARRQAGELVTAVEEDR
ncbi:MAG: SDR family NAD(P)-dependent oxidoreductase [Acidobacteriota bacterium]